MFPRAKYGIKSSGWTENEQKFGSLEDYGPEQLIDLLHKGNIMYPAFLQYFIGATGQGENFSIDVKKGYDHGKKFIPGISMRHLLDVYSGTIPKPQKS